MYSTLTTLIDRLDSTVAYGASVIRWSCPVPSFGDLSKSRVATLGLNPSSREFLDESGNELEGASRRFHTLTSLGIKSWPQVDARHLEMILKTCRSYFLGNPYNRWFKRLNEVVVGANASYYDAASRACHLDLIPYATARKWTELTAQQRSSLVTLSQDTLALLLRDSPIRILILNGRSVVERFQEMSGVRLEGQQMIGCSLPRQSKPDVVGFGYKGVVDTVSGIALGHEVMVLGFNHNLQSSFGVTNEVVRAIRDWISNALTNAVR